MAYITKKQYDQLVSILAQLNITLADLRDAIRGVDARTHTDLYNQLASLITNLGTQSYDAGGWLLSRIKHSYYTSYAETGNVTVPAGTSYTYLDYSGAGLCHKNLFRHRSSGIVPENARHGVICDYAVDPYPTDIVQINMYGEGSVGAKTVLKCYVMTWDTVNNIYDVRSNAIGEFYPFASSLKVRLRNFGGVDAVMTGVIHYSKVVSSTILEFIRSEKEFTALEVRQQLIDLGYENTVAVHTQYDEELAVNKSLLTICTEKTLTPEQVNEITKFVYDKEYAVEIVRIENVLTSPRKLLYKVTPIELVQKALSKVCRVGREIPVLPRLRAGRIEETVALIPTWLNRLRPDISGRVHSPQEINEILTRKPYEIIP